MRFQHFCADCGSPLFTSGEGDQADDWGIRWGSIRQRDKLRPVRQIWCQSAAVWIDAVPLLPGPTAGLGWLAKPKLAAKKPAFARWDSAWQPASLRERRLVGGHGFEPRTLSV